MVENQSAVNPNPQAQPRGANKHKSKFTKSIEQQKQQAQQKQLPQVAQK